MQVEVLLTESEIMQEFSDALEARDLPEKFFYWSPHAVNAWLALSRDLAYESQSQGWNLLVSDVGMVREHLNSRAAVVSLGAGDGSKDVAFAKALVAAGVRVEYFPVDASAALIEMACTAAEDADLEVSGIKADISSPMHLLLAADASDDPKVFLMTGSTLGGLDPIEQIAHVRHAMKPGDRLIVDAEIHDAAAMTARDSTVARRFAFSPLAAVGVSADHGEVGIDLKHDDRLKGLSLITRWFHTNEDLRVELPGREIMIQRGERISLNFNYTYTEVAFRRLLTDHGKLRILAQSASPDGRFLTAVCAGA